MPWNSLPGYYAAAAQGYFKDEGLDVTLAGVDSPPESLTRLAKGTADADVLPAFFLAPGSWRPGLAHEREPSRAALFLVRWLLFRLMLGSGLVKLASGDAGWTDGTALTFHYFTQPIPNINRAARTHAFMAPPPRRRRRRRSATPASGTYGRSRPRRR